MTRFQSLLDRPLQAAWVGEWARIWIKPDLFSPQEFFVGAVALQDGVADFRLLTALDRFSCVYGEDRTPIFEQLFAALRAELAAARAARIPVEQLQPPHPFRLELVGNLRTALVGEALDRMLRDGSIPMEPDEPSGRKQRFASRAASDVVSDILNRVRLKSPGEADRIIRDVFYGSEAGQATVNLVTPSAAGIVASGWYARGERIQLEFLLAANQVEAYAASARKTSALFFARPTDQHGLSADTWADVERRLQILGQQQAQKGTRVFADHDPEHLAAQVAEWALAHT